MSHGFLIHFFDVYTRVQVIVHYDVKVLYVCARSYGGIIKVNFSVLR